MSDVIRAMSDERLLDLVQTMDRIERPLERRYEGDDTSVVELMTELGLTQNIVNKALVTGLVMRECLHRGLHIPRGN